VNDIGILKYCSSLTVIAVIIFTIVLIVKTILHASPTVDLIYPQGTGFNLIVAIPNLFVAYVFQYNVFPLYMALENRSNRNLLKSCYFGITLACFLYLLFGNFGYMAFGNSINQSVLSSLSSSSGAILVISELSLACLVFNSYPLLFMEYKKNIMRLILDIRTGFKIRK